MAFLEALRPEVVCIAPSWRTFDATVDGLLAVLVDAGELAGTARTAARAAIVEREREASTALLDIHAGVPHARLAALDRPIAALAVSPDGLYEPVPTVAIQIVALLLSPLEATSAHLEALADVATLLRSAALRARLLAAGDAGEALRALHDHARDMPGAR